MTVVLTIAALLVVGWFAAGTLWNVRKGGAVMRWMQGGLPLLGPRATVRWLGSTTVELGIAGAKPPFERVTLVIFLEPRDLPWLWGITHLRGRRDTLIVRAQLRNPPEDTALGQREALLELASRAGLAVRRLALRPQAPHVELHLDLPPLAASAADTFEALRALGERAERSRAAPL
jgi:hypothetical protein